MERSSSSRSAAASRPNTTTSIRTRRSRPIPMSVRRELRRARLGVEGVVYYDVKYILEVDFANDVVAVKDAYLQYQGVKIGDTPLYFRAGNFRTPNSFELLTSELLRRYARACGLRQRVGSSIGRSASRSAIGPTTGAWRPVSSATASTRPTDPQPLFPGFTGDEDVTFAARAYGGSDQPPGERRQSGAAFRRERQDARVGDDQPLLQYDTQRGADLPSWPTTRSTRGDRRRGYLLGPRGCHPVGTVLSARRVLLISTLICRRRLHSCQSARGRTASIRHRIPVRPVYARPILNTMAGMSRYLVLRRPQELQQGRQVGSADDRQSDALE